MIGRSLTNCSRKEHKKEEFVDHCQDLSKVLNLCEIVSVWQETLAGCFHSLVVLMRVWFPWTYVIGSIVNSLQRGWTAFLSLYLIIMLNIEFSFHILYCLHKGDTIENATVKPILSVG